MKQEAGFTSANLQVLLLKEKEAFFEKKKKALTKASAKASENQIKRQQ